MAKNLRGGFRIEWNGDEIFEEVVVGTVRGLAEYGLLHEREAKAQLAPGKGVLSGRVKRSVHSAPPSYNWKSDWAVPGRSMPELGGKLAAPDIEGDRVVIAVGTGIAYGVRVENRYQYLQSSWVQTLPRLEEMISDYCQELLGK